MNLDFSTRMKNNKAVLSAFAFTGLAAMVLISFIIMENSVAPSPNKNTSSNAERNDDGRDKMWERDLAEQYGITVGAQYENKFVYAYDQEADVSAMRAHCRKYGGSFNECGSPCAPDAEVCQAVCVFTCEFDEPDDDSETSESAIRLDFPQSGEVIESPLTVTGAARGTWYFEGQFNVVLTDWDGLIIAEASATAQDEWMTEDFVPFEATLEFEQPDYGDTGSLILQKANPSGLPENDAAYDIRIRFLQPIPSPIAS